MRGPGHPRSPIRKAALSCVAALWLATPCLAEPLPQPLALDAALELLPGDLPGDIIAAQYQETAIRARAFECRALDRTPARGRPDDRGCGYWHLLTPGQQSQLQLMRRFLDVVEADLRAARDDEAMAVAYVELDRARNREELGQYSALQVGELEVGYQRIRSDRYASQAAQRVTRSLLAMALGRPGELPADVISPELPAFPRTLDEVDALVSDALARNTVLKAWRERADTEASTAVIAQQLERDLREAVLQLWLDYSVLLADRDADASREHFRDLYLERSRTLYEMEVKADLGDSMTEQTAARLAKIQTDHRLVMLLATLNALRGNPLLPLTESTES